MWVTRLLRAPGVELRRFILLLTATLIVASFALIGPLSKNAFAVDAIWNGTELTYEDNPYSEVTAPPNQQNLPNEYQWIDTSTQPNTAHVLYFGPNNPGQATSATLITYDFTGTSYTNPSSPTTINVSRDPTGSPEGGQTAGTTCTMTGGLGWILCPISNYLADGIDAVYGIVANFFNVQTINRTDNGVYQFWKVMQSFANAAFIAVFIAIIYSQITGAGYSNYNIKNMLPRLILGSILVNISFWICALAVDASNLLGYNLQSILVNIRENIPTTADTGEGLGWSALTTAVLAGGGVAGYAWMSASIATSGTALGFILLTFLIPAALSVLTAFIVLAARQALIVVLTAISPLAFVAFILPGTRELFNKWRKLFTSMLIMFPAFALLFGGSQIAAAAIINTSESAQGIMKFIIILVGLAVQIIPLALTPLLSRLSTGILGQITNMVNNREKGLADRAKTWAQDNADMHKGRKLTNMAKKRDDIQARLREREKNGEKLSRRNRHKLDEGYYGASRLALRMDQKKREREAHKKLSEDTLSGMHERDWNARHNDPKSRLDHRTASHRNTAYNLQKQAEREKGAFDANSEEGWNKYETSKQGKHYRELRKQTHLAKGRAKLDDDDMTSADELALKSMVRSDGVLKAKAKRAAINAKAATAHQESIDAEAAERWVRIQQRSPEYRTMRTDTELAKKRTEDFDKSMSAADQRTYDELVDTAATPLYRTIRDTKKQTIVDTDMAQFVASEVEAEGKREFRRLFEDSVAGSEGRQEQNIRIERLKKETGSIEATLQKQADESWDRAGKSDQSIQQLRLKEQRASDAAKRAETEWKELIQNIYAKGEDAPDLLGTDNTNIAKDMFEIDEETQAAEKAIEWAQTERSEQFVKKLKDDEELRKRAGGIGGKRAQTSIFAKAKAAVVNAAVEEVKTNRSLTSEMTRRQLHRLMQQGVMPDGSEATREMQQAAMYTLLQEKGNNEDAQEIRDSIANMGMMVDESTGLYYEPKRRPDGFLERDEYGFPMIDESRPITDPEEIEHRRDWQQFFLDAAKGSSHSMVTFSGTNKSEAGAGTMVDTMREGFARDAWGGKFSAEKMLKADVDELKFLLEDLSSPTGAFATLSPERKEAAKATIKRSILALQENENINAGIDERNRGVMNDILNLIDPDEFAYDGDPTNRQYAVHENNAIIPRSKLAGRQPPNTFRPPVNTPGVHYRIPTKDGGERGYYQKWDVRV